MSLIVKSNLKEAATVDGKSLNISGDFADTLNAKVQALVKDACRRATDNGRSTVMAKDL
jgi:histone H3/H4